MASEWKWRARKAVRSGAARLAHASGWVAVRRRLSARPRIRALTYHQFGDVARDPWILPAAEFDAQMRWIAERRLAVSLADVRGFLSGTRRLAEGSLLITIDDGCASTYREALPILRNYGLPAVAFVSAGLIESRTATPRHEDRYCNWRELAALQAAGVEVGSHAFDHRSLGRLPADAAFDQLQRSRGLLEERLGTSVWAVAYPFGMRADFDAETERQAARAGYELSFSALHGAIHAEMGRHSLPRVKVEAGESLATFALTCAGAMDAWRLVDESVGRLRTHRVEQLALPASDTAS